LTTGRVNDRLLNLIAECLNPNFLLGDQIKNVEMGGACSTYGGEDRRIQGFGGESWVKKTTWKAQV